ncbi:MAG: twin-arginine translocase TatA/TatE family subunit [Methylobacter sp.]|jgi:sec-independent protein translocase protein TatA|nr:twin-arginine translocase TatA/TatE family subunit [Methylococcales bacterium]MDD2801523.1 twin-arginine translocase TatA/TatE family subunit [Methylococcales bacterium]MDD5112613.1 twin-arginine translocase TatA/TatE family subunit [Methylobacter sp.]
MGIGVSELLIILVIVVVLFGTKRLRNIGGDLGGAIKSFRTAVKDGENDKKSADSDSDNVDGETTSKKNENL